MIDDVQVALAAARAEYIAAEQAEVDERRRRAFGPEIVTAHIRHVRARARTLALRVPPGLAGRVRYLDDPTVLSAVDEALALAVEELARIA